MRSCTRQGIVYIVAVIRWNEILSSEPASIGCKFASQLRNFLPDQGDRFAISEVAFAPLPYQTESHHHR